MQRGVRSWIRIYALTGPIQTTIEDYTTMAALLKSQLESSVAGNGLNRAAMGDSFYFGTEAHGVDVGASSPQVFTGRRSSR